MRHVQFNFLIVICLPSLVIAQPQVERVLPERGYFPGTVVEVELIVNNLSSDMLLIDQPPIGWDIVKLVYGSRNYPSGIDGDRIKLIPRNLSRPYSIIYYVRAPKSAGGEFSFHGTIGDSEITGTNVIRPMKMEPFGDFQNHMDIGKVESSHVEYNEQTGEYRIKAGKSASTVPHGHHLYREVYGDCSIEAQAKVIDPTVELYQRAALAILSEMYLEATWFGLEVKPNDECWCGWGEGMGFDWADRIAWPPIFDGRIRVERQGDTLRAYYYDLDFDDWFCIVEKELVLEDPVYLVMFSVCSNAEFTLSSFRNVILTYEQKTTIEAWDLY